MTVVPVTSPDLDAAEVSWFAALCSDDYRFLGVPEGDLRSSWAHCSAILKEAEAQGFRNILCPSSYQVGQDTLSFVAAGGQVTDKINMLAAVRCGEMQPIMLARTIATLDHMLEGRLTVNIISSDFPGEKADSGYPLQRSREVVEILKQAWTQDEINYAGEVYDFKGLTTDPVKPYQTGGPLLYFGGYSPDALELCGQHCDVYLMWPEPKDQIAERMKAVNQVAEKYDRTLDYGLRVHVIVRDTEAGGAGVCRAPRLQARRRVGHADPRTRARFGIARRQPPGARAGTGGQFGYVEPHLWTGIGRARSGCGAAIVGSADQVLSEIEEYRKMGIRAFIFSGYPHLEECRHFGRLVMPELKTCSLPVEYGRVPAQVPATPLGAGERR
jgi:alkanesulfonate monooxygenase